MRPSTCYYLAATLMLVSGTAALAQGAPVFPTVLVAVGPGALFYALGRARERTGR